jgi:hypothetical protein
MPFCAQVGAVFLVATTYFLLAPLVLGRLLRARFDGELFTPAYWASVEEVFPFYRYRRAMLYLGVLGWPVLARRRFPGYDFAPKSNPALRLASWLYTGIGALALVAAAYELVVGLRC